MTVVDDLVKKSILAYPSIFTSRADVLHHVLCVIGNGYVWENGTLVPVFKEDDRVWTAEWETARFYERYGELGGFEMSDAHNEHWAQYIKEVVAEYQQVVDTVDERIHDWTYEGEGIYPQSDYALILNVPEDVNPEWHEDLEKMREFARGRGWKI